MLKLFKQYMWSCDSCSSTLKLVKKHFRYFSEIIETWLASFVHHFKSVAPEEWPLVYDFFKAWKMNYFSNLFCSIVLLHFACCNGNTNHPVILGTYLVFKIASSIFNQLNLSQIAEIPWKNHDMSCISLRKSIVKVCK